MNKIKYEKSIAEIKNSLEWFNSRFQQEEEWANLKTGQLKLFSLRSKKKKNGKKKGQSLGCLSDTIKYNNECIMGVSEGEERENEAKRIFKQIMSEKSPKFGEIYEHTH